MVLTHNVLIQAPGDELGRKDPVQLQLIFPAQQIVEVDGDQEMKSGHGYSNIGAQEEAHNHIGQVMNASEVILVRIPWSFINSFGGRDPGLRPDGSIGGAEVVFRRHGLPGMLENRKIEQMCREQIRVNKPFLCY